MFINRGIIEGERSNLWGNDDECCGKKVHIADYRAKRLDQLAGERGITESALMEEGLDLLFREHANQNSTREELRPDWELLQQWEREHGILGTREPALKLNPDEIVSMVGTSVDPAKIRRIGELS